MPQVKTNQKSALPKQAVPQTAPYSGNNGAAAVREPKALKISTVSHTLDVTVAERLRHFAFRERISESAVIEFAIREFFDGGDDLMLGNRLRESGAALRRKS